MVRLDADSRRRQLVDATIRVIAEHGVGGTTTRRIAAEAGFPLASLHYAFHTKDDLFIAVFEALWDEPQNFELEQSLNTAGKRAAAVLRKSIEWLIDHPMLARVQAELFYWGLRNNPSMSSRGYSLTIEHSKRMFRQVLGSEVDETLLDEISRLDVWLTDGLLTSWFAHNDTERLRKEAQIAYGLMEKAASSGVL